MKVLLRPLEDLVAPRYDLLGRGIGIGSPDRSGLLL